LTTVQRKKFEKWIEIFSFEKIPFVNKERASENSIEKNFFQIFCMILKKLLFKFLFPEK